MKRIGLQDLYTLIRQSKQELALQLTVAFEFADTKSSERFSAAFVEAAIQGSVNSMHGAIGSLLFPLTLLTINPYNRTAKLLLGNIGLFDMLWTALMICEPVNTVRYKLCLKELAVKEPDVEKD